MGKFFALALAFAILFGCDNDQRLESPTVRPPLQGSLEILPIPGVLAGTVELSGLESGHSVILDQGVSASANALSWHRFGKAPNLVEVAWLAPRHGAEGDTYTFQFRTYDSDNQATVEKLEFVYNGDRVVLYLRGKHEFTLEPLIATDE